MKATRSAARIAAVIGVGAALTVGCARGKGTVGEGMGMAAGEGVGKGGVEGEGRGGVEGVGRGGVEGEGKGGVEGVGKETGAEVWGRFDFGEVVQGAVLEHEFEIENRAGTPIELGGVVRVHGCTARAGRVRVGAGEKGRLGVRCPLESAGAFRLRLPIVVEPARAPLPELELIANVTPRLAFGAKLLELDMPFGATRSQEIDLIGALAERAELKLVPTPENSPFEVGISAKLPGRAQRVKVTCKGKPVGVHTGNLTFATQLDEPRTITLPYSCKVHGTLSVSPTNPYINLRVSGEKYVDVEVSSSAPGFAVKSVEISEGPFAARVEPGAQPSVFHVKVSVVDARLPDEARSATGTLRILSNDRAEPRKEIPLFAFGRLNR